MVKLQKQSNINKLTTTKNLDKITIQFLMKINFHLNKKNLSLNEQMNTLIFGKYNHLYIFNIQKLIWYLKYFYYNLTSLFKERYNILIVNNINIKIFDEILKDTIFFNNNSKFKNYLNITGMVNNTWYNGLISNWKIVYDLINKIMNSQTNLTSKELKTKQILNSFKHRLASPSVPDLLLFFDINKKGLKESLKLNLPIISYTNNVTNSDNFLYYVLGNTKSLYSIEFILTLIELSIINSIYLEQKTFKLILLKKIYKLLKQGE